MIESEDHGSTQCTTLMHSTLHTRVATAPNLAVLDATQRQVHSRMHSSHRFSIGCLIYLFLIHNNCVFLPFHSAYNYRFNFSEHAIHKCWRTKRIIFYDIEKRNTHTHTQTYSLTQPLTYIAVVAATGINKQQQQPQSASPHRYYGFTQIHINAEIKWAKQQEQQQKNLWLGLVLQQAHQTWKQQLIQIRDNIKFAKMVYVSLRSFFLLFYHSHSRSMQHTQPSNNEYVVCVVFAIEIRVYRKICFCKMCNLNEERWWFCVRNVWLRAHTAQTEMNEGAKRLPQKPESQPTLSIHPSSSFQFILLFANGHVWPTQRQT